MESEPFYAKYQTFELNLTYRPKNDFYTIEQLDIDTMHAAYSMRHTPRVIL